MAEVALEHVAKVFPNGVRAVCDLCLKAADGELVALVGPSGSGKTTILRLIAGLEEPTAGTIRIDGQKVNQLTPRQRGVALVFQRHDLYPHLSVRGNLSFGWQLRHERSWPMRLWETWFRPGRRRQVQAELAERVAVAARVLGLEEVLERRPSQLSGGQQQRAALGRALVRQPAVYLLDEPLSNLDSHLRAELRRELHLLQRRFRATMIYVTHDQVEAMTLGDRLVVLDRGVVQQADRPEVIYDHPRNRFVAGFIGWPPMNLVDGRLAREDGRCSFVGKGWDLPIPESKAAEWAPYLERPVTLGIRPEHMGLRQRQPGEAALTMEVALVEMLGSDCLVTWQRGDWQMTGKMERSLGLARGQKVEVVLAMQQTYLFDQTSGEALAGPSG